jgi:CO/xanthine dehydrogenase FAD-binding subunit
MVAAAVEIDNGRVAAARIAVGACSPVARRLAVLERAIIGRPVDDLASSVRAEHLTGLTPIDDIRAGAAYRRDAALTLVRRALEQLARG